jgi:hypothetical protein
MSQRTRKYKRIEALFSKGQPVAPDSPLRAGAKVPAPGIAANDRSVSAEETDPESVVPPAAASSDSGWRDFINGVDRGRKMGFTCNHGKVSAWDETTLPITDNGLLVPVMVSGKMIGAIQGAGNEAGWTAQEIEMVSAVAAQLGEHLENLRRMEQREAHS